MISLIVRTIGQLLESGSKAEILPGAAAALHKCSDKPRPPILDLIDLIKLRRLPESGLEIRNAQHTLRLSRSAQTFVIRQRYFQLLSRLLKPHIYWTS